MGEDPPSSIPKHVAVIMDGNGRWAQSRGLPRKAGHRAGAESVREAVDVCLELGVEYLTLYAFSSENWNRPEKEISTLMKLLEQFLKTKGKEFMKRMSSSGPLDESTACLIPVVNNWIKLSPKPLTITPSPSS